MDEFERFNGQLTRHAEADFATVPWQALWPTFEKLNDLPMLQKCRIDFFLLIDGPDPSWRFAPPRMSVTRRGIRICVKAGVALEEWQVLPMEARAGLVANRILEMLDAVCARAIMTLGVKPEVANAFMQEFQQEYARQCAACYDSGRNQGGSEYG